MSTVSGVTQRKVEVRSNFERYAFLFMRTTGIALLILAVGHMVIQHLLNSVHNLTLQFVANQWNDWGWKAYDLLLLVFAFTHGMNGLRTVLGDYIHNRNTMKIINIILAVFVVITIIWAGYAIASFDAAPFLE
jgi:succinate dehydrogenase / fumarate reductase membrane anchor subunit